MGTLGRRRDGQALAALVVASRWVPIYRQRIGPDSMVLTKDSSHMNPEHMNPEHPVGFGFWRHADASPPDAPPPVASPKAVANITTTCGSTATTCVNICTPTPWRATHHSASVRAAASGRVSIRPRTGLRARRTSWAARRGPRSRTQPPRRRAHRNTGTARRPADARLRDDPGNQRAQ